VDSHLGLGEAAAFNPQPQPHDDASTEPACLAVSAADPTDVAERWHQLTAARLYRSSSTLLSKNMSTKQLVQTVLQEQLQDQVADSPSWVSVACAVARQHRTKPWREAGRKGKVTKRWRPSLIAQVSSKCSLF
jgi:hypothetical protein